MEIPPENRIFHIDRECYIIYLGSDPDDYKPFLRIGNSKNLPDIIKENIYYIVITDSLTGNPLLEPENMNRENIHENKYVGDKKSLSEFFKFLNCFNIKTEGYPITDKIQENKNKAVISYFDNGNLTLHYNKKLIFDLKKREKEDLHFNEFANNIKNQIKLDPLYLGYNYFKSIDYGFVCIGNSIIHINKGQFSADELPDNYFEKLIYYRLDPDLLTSAIISKADENLIHLLKRKLNLNEKLEVISKHKDKIVNCTVNLFAKKNELISIRNRIDTKDIYIKIDDNKTILENNKTNITIITERGKKYSSLSKYPELDMKNTFVVKINPETKEIVYKIKQKIIHQSIIEGIPYIINNYSEIDTLKLENDIEDTLSFFKESFNAQETTLLNTLKSLLKSQIKEDYMVESYLKSSEKLIKRTKLGTLASLIAISLINITKYHTLKNNLQDNLIRLSKIEGKLTGSIPSSTKTDRYIPLIANIYTKHPIVIYTLTKRGLNITDYQYSIDNEKEVRAVSRINFNIFENDKSNLILLLENLTKRRLISPSKPQLASQEKEIKTSKKLEITEVEEAGEALTKKEKISESLQKSEIKNKKIKTPSYLKKKKSKKRKSILMVIPIAAIVILTGLYFILKSKITTTTHEKKNISVSVTASDKQVSTEKTKNIQENQEISPIEEKTTIKSETKIISEVVPEKSAISKKKIESFLDLGYIKITILDVYKLTNKIAKSNGYRTLDNPDELGKDPNWIYPGNMLKLPDNSIYTVTKGDTIWYIAKRFIKKELDADWIKYQNIKKAIEKGNLNNETKKNISNNLIEMKKRTYSENFKKLLEKTINDLKK